MTKGFSRSSVSSKHDRAQIFLCRKTSRVCSGDRFSSLTFYCKGIRITPSNTFSDKGIRRFSSDKVNDKGIRRNLSDKISDKGMRRVFFLDKISDTLAVSITLPVVCYASTNVCLHVLVSKYVCINLSIYLLSLL